MKKLILCCVAWLAVAAVQAADVNKPAKPATDAKACCGESCCGWADCCGKRRPKLHSPKGAEQAGKKK